jgi:hypothetical protein
MIQPATLRQGSNGENEWSPTLTVGFQSWWSCCSFDDDDGGVAVEDGDGDFAVDDDVETWRSQLTQHKWALENNFVALSCTDHFTPFTALTLHSAQIHCLTVYRTR